MAMELRQQMKLTQQLVMTPQLQQAIKLLQLSRIELQEVILQELEENPVLEETAEPEAPGESELELLEKDGSAQEEKSEEFQEVQPGQENFSETDWENYIEGYNFSTGEQYRDDDDDERTSFENLLTRKGTLSDHLMWQLNLTRLTEQETLVGIELIGNIDDEGYLRSSAAEIAELLHVEEDLVERVLGRIQEFDPVGVAARDLRESLLLQVRHLGMDGTLVEAILLNHLKDLETRRYKQIARAEGVELGDVLLAAKIIANLDPKPGMAFSQDDVHYISADIFVYKIGEEYMVVLNDDGLPNLRLNPAYAGEGKSRNLDSKTEEYLNEKTRSAVWLMKSIQQRQRTIYKVAKSLVKFQRDFLDRGIEYLRPLVLRDIAEDIGMHESTISRVTTNKYMQTPQGLFELKYFFNSGISVSGGDFIASESVKNRIKDIIDGEDPRKPYSDQKLAEILAKESIEIARRTVTKYREMLRIGSSSERRRLF